MVSQFKKALESAAIDENANAGRLKRRAIDAFKISENARQLLYVQLLFLLSSLFAL